MKYLFLILVSLNCFAGGWAPVGKEGYSEKTYPKFHEFKHQCEEAENHPCYDIDICPEKYCELVDNYILDHIATRQYEVCESEEDCDEKFSRIVCVEGEEIKNYETLSVYCAVNIMRAEGKKLVESPSKKAAYEAKMIADREAIQIHLKEKLAAKARVKAFIPVATTVLGLKAELKAFANDVKEVLE
jgi:hypothetical protein